MMVKPPTRCKLQTRGVRSRSEKERENELNGMDEKRAHYPSLYRPRRGGTSSPPPCGTKLPKGGKGAAREGVKAPPLAPWAKGGNPLLPSWASSGTYAFSTFLINI